MNKYADIISRLEAATGPSRELDFWISIRCDDENQYTDQELQGDIDLVGIDKMHPDGPYTSSLDAAIGLVERMLPGGEITLTDTHADFLSKGEHRHSADIMRGLVWSSREGFPQPDYEMQAIGSSSTRPIALLIALFRALEALEAQS